MKIGKGKKEKIKEELKREFEFEFLDGTSSDGIITRIYPEKKEGVLTGRYICKEDVNHLGNAGEYESDCHDTTHTKDKDMALEWVLKIIKKYIDKQRVGKDLLKKGYYPE